jgi:glucose/arabinose dehydrogenase
MDMPNAGSRLPVRGSALGVGSAVLLLTATIGCAQRSDADQVVSTEDYRIRVVTVVGGLEHPWGLAFLPDGRMLVTERPGRLRIVKDGVLDPEPVAGVPDVAAVGQGGLLDIALHPDYASNGWIYLSYSASGEGGVGTELARGRLQGRRLTDVEVLFRLHPKSGRGRHFGGRIVFDREGYVYLTLGDRGERPRAQQLDDHAGSVIRLHADGRVPRDNPFIDQENARAEIYTYGNRNVQGAARDPQTGEVWTHEHGPQGGDEVNIIHAGTNYGWPVITYGVNYVTGTKIGEGTHKEGMAQPIHYWVPSIAPSGMAFYTGERFPAWRGDMFVGALKDQMLVRLEIEGERVIQEERMLKGVLGRIRDVRDGPDGYLYLLTDAPNGVLARLEPAP